MQDGATYSQDGEDLDWIHTKVTIRIDFGKVGNNVEDMGNNEFQDQMMLDRILKDHQQQMYVIASSFKVVTVSTTKDSSPLCVVIVIETLK